jgi:non-homologous end joining protein Ku
MSVDRLDDLELVDHYREALAEVIEAKAEHRQPKSAGHASSTRPQPRSGSRRSPLRAR